LSLFALFTNVNTTILTDELEKIRNSVNHQAPLGKDEWHIIVASQHGLLPTLGSRGRPKKESDVLKK